MLLMLALACGAPAHSVRPSSGWGGFVVGEYGIVGSVSSHPRCCCGLWPAVHMSLASESCLGPYMLVGFGLWVGTSWYSWSTPLGGPSLWSFWSWVESGVQKSAAPMDWIIFWGAPPSQSETA